MNNLRETPNNIEAESAVLAGILVDEALFGDISELLQPQDFYRNAHRVIFEAMTKLDRQHAPLDPISVANMVEEMCKASEEEPVGFSYLATLQHGVLEGSIDIANTLYYAKVVRGLAVRRRLIHAAGQVAQIGFDEEDGDLALTKAETLLRGLASGKPLGRAQDVVEVTGDYISRLGVLHEQFKRGVVSGVPSGFADLDRMTGGFQRSDLIVLAARPGRGKTALMLSFAREVMHFVSTIGRDYKTLVFSLEMSGYQLAQRLVAMETGIDQARLRMAQIDDQEFEQISKAHDEMPENRLWIDDTPGLTIADIRNRARRHQHDFGLDFLIVDYMQLLTATMDNGKPYADRLQEVSRISRDLKALARELDVPLLALAQLSRAVEARGDKMPKLSDLRESGTIEQDSDIVMFLYKDEEVNKNTQMEGGEIITLLLAKHRNGGVGPVNLFFRNKLTRFDSLDFTPGEES